MKTTIFTIYLLLSYYILTGFSLYADNNKINPLKFNPPSKSNNSYINEDYFLKKIIYKNILFINSGAYKSNKQYLKLLKFYKKQLINEISFKKSYKTIEKYSVGFF